MSIRLIRLAEIAVVALLLAGAIALLCAIAGAAYLALWGLPC